jgi:hypothetical protein
MLTVKYLYYSKEMKRAGARQFLAFFLTLDRIVIRVFIFSLKNKLNLLRTEAKAPQLRKRKGKSCGTYHLNMRHGILDLPDIAVLTGEQHQRHQGPAHQ